VQLIKSPLSITGMKQKKMEREKQKQKNDEQLSPEMVIKIREIRPKGWRCCR